MKPNDRVQTPYGPGSVVSREGKEGILNHRYCIKLDSFGFVPKHLDLSWIQDRFGGVYFFDSELNDSTGRNDNHQREGEPSQCQTNHHT